MTYELINPDQLGAPSGWTNGMLAPAGGRILFVAGQDAAGPEGKVTTDEKSRKELGAAYRSLMGKHFPAMALLQIRGLVDPRAKIELEVTAVIAER